MKPALLIAAVGLVIVTIGTRAIPISDADHSRALFGALIILSLTAGVAVYRIYRRELLRIQQPSRKFPLAMAFITCVLLIQVSLRISQL